MKNQPEFSIEQYEYFEKESNRKKCIALDESQALRREIARILFANNYHNAPLANSILLSKLVAQLIAKCSEYENIELY